MSRIYIIRHGQASFGSDNYDELSELGRRQAVVLNEYLQQCDIRFDAVYSGDLQRQQDTAELATDGFAGNLPHTVDVRFNEVRNDEQIEFLLPKVIEQDSTIRELIDKGLESSKDYQKAIEAVFNYWVAMDWTHPEIQSWSAFSTAVHRALDEVMANHGSGKTIGIFTSGGTIATIVAHVLGVDDSLTYRFYEPVINCSVTQLFYSRQRVSLGYFNDHSYLDVLGRQRTESLLTYR